MWILMFVTLRSENRLQLISFSKIWCLAELQFGMILWIVGFQLLEDFFESMKRSSFLDTKFWCFFEMSFLGVVLNDDNSNIRLLETPHEIFWHLFLIHPLVIQCAYPWRELSISVNKSCQSFPCMNSWVSPRVRTNQSHHLWWLSMFLVLSCCCSEWWFCPSVFPDVRTSKIWKQIGGHYNFLS